MILAVAPGPDIRRNSCPHAGQHGSVHNSYALSDKTGQGGGSKLLKTIAFFLACTLPASSESSALTLLPRSPPVRSVPAYTGSLIVELGCSGSMQRSRW